MKKIKMKSIAYLLMSLLILNQPVFADDAQLVHMVSQLQKQMIDMQKTIQQQNDKIERLERERQTDTASIPSMASGSQGVPAAMTDKEFDDRLGLATGGANKWLKDLKFSGDMRLRYEAFHYSTGNQSGTDDQNRFRYRLRYGFEKTFNPEMKIGFAMASGEQAGGASNDPNSTNTSFDKNFNFKPIFIEKAFANYKPRWAAKIGPLKETEITAGKFTNPFEKGSSDLVFDRDIKPEGIAEKFTFNLMDTEDMTLPLYVMGGQFVLDEDATDHGDANLFAAQIGIEPEFRTPFSDSTIRNLHAVSFYNFSNYARGSNFTIDGGAGTTATSLARTNSNLTGSSAELDAGRFEILEYYTELGFKAVNLPVTLSYDVAGNIGDDSSETLSSSSNTVTHENFAQGFGVKLNSIKKKGDWELGYWYKWIGANSVPAGFNDSDFGAGFTSKAGSVIKAGYGITDAITLNFGYYLVRNLNSGTVSGLIDQTQNRWQLDLSWKF